MTDWHIEGEWFKNCNCDPGCPCDFNQRPTHGHCDGMVAMRITKGYFGDVDLAACLAAFPAGFPGDYMIEVDVPSLPLRECHQVA